jgi:nucleotide-binding universal stress UspA family protein
VQELSIRNVLCAVEFGPRADLTVSWGAQIAAEFGARLTLANVTASVEFWGPGGGYVNQKWKEELVGNASEQMAKLQQDSGIKADVFIGSGDVPKVLSQAAKERLICWLPGATLMAVTCGPTATESFARCRFRSSAWEGGTFLDKPAITAMMGGAPRVQTQHIERSVTLALPAEILRVRQAAPLQFPTHEGDSWLASVCCFDQRCEQ